ncbi:AAA family ATPase [Aestuariivirga sp. YIM B02566]|uniref:AAA family ATPase n=1 Tax=Taklimakanibacter albus TaxID=2800327 RepID=A0ACC5RFU1_9HYPH|nr:AAA family ATPase [Aestuariivirga sp. YIM B02566]MBK1871561.1 AAA family ATPase [Aestuariivirga sp. YIM B02566]
MLFKPKGPNLLVINLWAGPGAGKSTTAAGLFNLMKLSGYRVELVTEVAKDLVYEERIKLLNDNQLLVLALQDHRLRRLVGKADIAITDSPLPLSIVYKPAQGLFSASWLNDTALALWRDYENYNILVKRSKPYQKYGRTQTLEEARKLDARIEDLAIRLCGSRAKEVKGDEHAPRAILNWLQRDKGLMPKEE